MIIYLQFRKDISICYDFNINAKVFLSFLPIFLDLHNYVLNFFIEKPLAVILLLKIEGKLVVSNLYNDLYNLFKKKWILRTYCANLALIEMDEMAEKNGFTNVFYENVFEWLEL